ncbi:uncharacterized protein N7483_008084 [Penicillium malachiteum]|uniref:uncharacterized protein n=1 Tax=Penicillium malachiteum TaxID=1324776 RepID=UPI002546A320|nr:uncharacterized protein N7483_008084 [Penicillium malachiteum]KAJ5726727.1 hypothetical protein N7483_008084 [Penicillium malachiteum]
MMRGTLLHVLRNAINLVLKFFNLLLIDLAGMHLEDIVRNPLVGIVAGILSKGTSNRTTDGSKEAVIGFVASETTDSTTGEGTGKTTLITLGFARGGLLLLLVGTVADMIVDRPGEGSGEVEALEGSHWHSHFGRKFHTQNIHLPFKEDTATKCQSFVLHWATF